MDKKSIIEKINKSNSLLTELQIEYCIINDKQCDCEKCMFAIENNEGKFICTFDYLNQKLDFIKKTI